MTGSSVRRAHARDTQAPHRWRAGLSAALLAGALAACGSDRSGARAADSALDRDLTLAGAAGPVTDIPMGDTATRSSSPVRQPQNQAQTERPASRGPTPARVPTQRNPQSSGGAGAPTTVPSPAASPDPKPAATSSDPNPTTAASASGDPAAAANTGNAPGRATRSLGAGTTLIASTTSQLCSLANRPGDKIVANLSSEVTGPDGARLPAGTPVLIEMAVAEPPADFAFRVRGVQVNGQLIPVEGRVAADGETTDRRVSKGGDKGKVATGAVIGAILGRVLGGGTKGTVIGAAGGAATGSVIAARNSTVEHCLPSGARITVTLTTPLVFPAPSQ